MSHDVNMLKAKLRRSFDSVGKSNGHACPQTQSNIDPTLHELFIASEALAYWKTRHDKAKDDAMASCVDADKLAETLTRVTKNDAGEAMVAAEGEAYIMSIDISKPANRLDQKALRNYMRTELNLTADQIDKAFDEATDKATPAKRIKVLGR